MTYAPPYTLSAPRFAFPALANLAGRAPLGGEREVAIAAFLAARLTHGCSGLLKLPVASRAVRASAAKTWLASLALPAVTRLPLTRLVEASAADAPEALALAFTAAAAAVAPYLDAAARRELDGLGQSLTA